MTIRYYVHAWQGLAMFLAGIASVLAAFAGYIQSGGGEELLRRELAHLQTGRAQFDTISFRWKTGEMVVTNLRHNSFSWPKKNPIASFSGLLAREMTVKMDLLPWPPAVQSITIRGMPDTAIAVSEGFLQTGKLQSLRYDQIPPIRFVDCNLDIKIGVVGPLKLSGCSGELRRGSGNEPPRGTFSLRELDGRPFNFQLETL
ncbi:MAG: hypothetical protein NTW87_29985 [Planctomycetota bacterium]|nr:hypothetical protein [Planctomycetota bacterium]